MRGVVYATEAAAAKAIAAIDAALGPTETVSIGGVTTVVPRKTWAATAVPLRDGTWLVPTKARIRPIAGRIVDVGGEAVTVPDDAAAVTKTDAQIDTTALGTRTRVA